MRQNKKKIRLLTLQSTGGRKKSLMRCCMHSRLRARKSACISASVIRSLYDDERTARARDKSACGGSGAHGASSSSESKPLFGGCKTCSIMSLSFNSAHDDTALLTFAKSSTVTVSGIGAPQPRRSLITSAPELDALGGRSGSSVALSGSLPAVSAVSGSLCNVNPACRKQLASMLTADIKSTLYFIWLSKQRNTRCSMRERYSTFKFLMIRWSIGCRILVVFSSRYSSSMAFRQLIGAWAVQLSTNKRTLRFCNTNFRSNFPTYSANSFCATHDFVLASYQTGRFFFPLKHRGFFDFPITRSGSFSVPEALQQTTTVTRFLLSLPPWQGSPERASVFSGSSL
nr:uncharacterized protein LOC119175849 [Rhipicephalus microplus]